MTTFAAESTANGPMRIGFFGRARVHAQTVARFGRILAVSLLASPPHVASDPLGPRGFTEHVCAEQRLVPLLLLPGSGRHHGPGSCAEGLAPAKRFSVTHRGKSVGEVVALERMRPSAVHALLIDTSLSMLMADRLRVARAFADAYVEHLPQGDRLAILRFSEIVELTSPGFTQDRTKLGEAVASIPLGMGTRIWDSIDLVFRELSVQPEPQKVLVVVSDAQDTLSWRSRDELSQLLKRHADIQVFLIGLPRIPYAELDDSLAFERMRTRHSNVDYWLLDEKRAPSISTLLYRVHAWLGRHAIATVQLYPEFQCKNRTARRGDSPFRVELRDPHAGSCRVTHREVSLDRAEALPPTTLLENESFREAFEQPTRHVSIPPPADWAEALSRQIPEQLTHRQRAKLKRKAAVLKLCGGRFLAEKATIPPAQLDTLQQIEVIRIDGDSGRLRGCLMNLARAPGRRWHAAALAGPATFGHFSPARLEMREFAIEVPLGPVVDDDPSIVLDRLAESTDTADLHAHLMEGESLLRQWPIVIAALVQFPELREHLLRRQRATVETQIEEFLDESRRRSGLASLTDEARSVLLATPRATSLRARLDAPQASDAKLHLASWLDDIPAHELFAMWEERLVGRYVSEVLRGGQRDRAIFLADTRSSWSRLAREFVPLHHHAVTPLVLLRQADPERLGFIRIVLPRMESVELRWHAARDAGSKEQPCPSESWPRVPYDLIPAMPLALLALDSRLQAEPELARLLREQPFDPPEIRYEANPDAGCAAWFAGADAPQHPYPRARISYRFDRSQGAATAPALDLTAEVSTDEAGGWQLLDFQWNLVSDRASN